METKIMNRLRGYDRHFRGRFLLLHNKALKDQELILWDLSYSCLADWDKSHGETYGSFEYDWVEIGLLLSWSGTKVGRNSKKLFLLGLWRRQGKRVYVAGFDLRDNFAQITKEEKVIDLQRELAKMQLPDANSQNQVADLNDRVSKGNGQISDQERAVLHENHTKAALVSSKGECKSDEEYRRYWEEIGCPSNFDISDMKWIDANTYEEKNL